MESWFRQKLIILKRVLLWTGCVNLLLRDVVWSGTRVPVRYSTGLMMAFSEPRTTWALVTILGPEMSRTNLAHSRMMQNVEYYKISCAALGLSAARISATLHVDIHTRSYECTHDTNWMHVDALSVSKEVGFSVSWPWEGWQQMDVSGTGTVYIIYCVDVDVDICWYYILLTNQNRTYRMLPASGICLLSLSYKWPKLASGESRVVISCALRVCCECIFWISKQHLTTVCNCIRGFTSQDISWHYMSPCAGNYQHTTLNNWRAETMLAVSLCAALCSWQYVYGIGVSKLVGPVNVKSIYGACPSKYQAINIEQP